MPGEALAALPKSELFARLAEGLAAGVTVVTPNRRLAQALAREFDAAQAAKGRAAWESADILPYAAFVERCYEDLLYSESGRGLPVLLTPAQEQALWEDAIEASAWGGGALLALAQAAGEARKAWGLAHLWHIDGALGKFPGNEDAEAFALWAADYRRRTRGERHIDAARLPDLVAGLMHESALGKPKLLVAYAFDILPRQTRLLFDACAAAGVDVRSCAPGRREADVVRRPFGSAREELAAAACWARARLEANQDLRIGIVVPDIEQRRKQVARTLADTLMPAARLSGAAAQPLPFNISMGVPLTEYALVHAALGLIELAGRGVDFALASRLVRSPFIAGAEREAMQRARLDAALRKIAPPQLSLARLLGAIGNCGVAAPELAARLSAAFEYSRAHWSGRKLPQNWAQQFAALLQAAGFPGSRTLDSAEFQTQEKWNQALAEFARLGRVTPAISFADALARLRRLCTGMLFQPESGAAPIHVLGVLESAGLEFDCLWVSGLTDEAWPLAARPSPFIPPALQKKAGIPEASAEGALALDRRITADWLTAAGEVVLSHATRDQDRELAPSPLIASLPEGSLDLPAYPRHRDRIHAARALENFADGKAPALLPSLPAGEGQGMSGRVRVRGGARVLADQAACPFRAYARHRLAAEALEAPVPGLDAAARGTLLHALMKCIWDELKTKAALEALPAADLAAIIERAAASAVARTRRENAIEERFAALERARLVRLAGEWLALERGRADFEVAATEDKRALAAGGLELSGRIDRMDRLAGGGYALIDYKSGRVTPKYWEGARPDDPQLPLYAVNAGEPVTAVTFAKLKTGGMRLMGYSRDDKVMPRVKQYRDWDGLLVGWKKELDALGSSFAAGEARVDPKRLAQTCRYCDLAPLCRVHEKLSALALDAGDAAGEAAEEGEGE